MSNMYVAISLTGAPNMQNASIAVKILCKTVKVIGFAQMENVKMKNRIVKAGQRPFRVTHDKELMACPFCADSPVLLHLDTDWIVHCPSCDCIIARQFTSDGVLVPFGSREQAVQRWNARHVNMDAKYAEAYNKHKTAKREKSVDNLAEHIKDAGTWVSITRLAKETFRDRSTVHKLMKYVLAKYPNIEEDKPGSMYLYRWK